MCSLCQLCEVRIISNLQRKVNILNSNQILEGVAICEELAY